MLWRSQWSVKLSCSEVRMQLTSSDALYFILCATGSFFTSARLIYAAGREGFLPSLFGRLHPTRRTPFNATLLQSVITILFIIFGGGFRSLINFSVVASWAFYFLTVFFFDEFKNRDDEPSTRCSALLYCGSKSPILKGKSKYY